MVIGARSSRAASFLRPLAHSQIWRGVTLLDNPAIPSSSPQRSSHSQWSIPAGDEGLVQGPSTRALPPISAPSWSTLSLPNETEFSQAACPPHLASWTRSRSAPTQSSPHPNPSELPRHPPFTNLLRHSSASAPAAASADPSTSAAVTPSPSSHIRLSKGSKGRVVKGVPKEATPNILTTFDGRQRKDNREKVGYSVLLHDLDIAATPVSPSEEPEQRAIEPDEEGSPEIDEEEEERAGDVVKPEQEPSMQVPIEVKKKAVFAVVQVGSHQFKVTPGDVIYTEKLLFADVNQRVKLDKVLLLGSRSETVVGRPTVEGAAVEALVEEQALAAKVIVFKKKRRKNYRRHNGHRQELTRLRILDVMGIDE